MGGSGSILNRPLSENLKGGVVAGTVPLAEAQQMALPGTKVDPAWVLGDRVVMSMNVFETTLNLFGFHHTIPMAFARMNAVLDQPLTLESGKVLPAGTPVTETVFTATDGWINRVLLWDSMGLDAQDGQIEVGSDALSVSTDSGSWSASLSAPQPLSKQEQQLLAANNESNLGTRGESMLLSRVDRAPKTDQGAQAAAATATQDLIPDWQPIPTWLMPHNTFLLNGAATSPPYDLGTFGSAQGQDGDGE
jgi:hypothetical protein